jgi:hypothetical protein
MYHLLSLAIAVSTVNADFIQTTFYLSSSKCSGQVFQTVSQLVGCSQQGSSSLTVTCLNSSAAIAEVFSGTDCTGPSTPIDVPFDSSCTATGAQSSLSQCVTGSYSAWPHARLPAPSLPACAPFSLSPTSPALCLQAAPPKGISIAYYAGPPNTCPAPKGAAPQHLQDITTNVCLQSSPATWVKFGCNAVNVTQATWTVKGCAGAPTSTVPALPLGCSPSPADPNHPDPNAGPRVVVCSKKQLGEQLGGSEEAAEMGEPEPLPMAEAKAAVAAALEKAAAAAAARALAL